MDTKNHTSGGFDLYEILTDVRRRLNEKYVWNPVPLPDCFHSKLLLAPNRKRIKGKNTRKKFVYCNLHDRAVFSEDFKNCVKRQCCYLDQRSELGLDDNGGRSYINDPNFARVRVHGRFGYATNSHGVMNDYGGRNRHTAYFRGSSGNGRH
jgi:hypothetical protein